MYIIRKIVRLRKEQVLPSEIERLLVDGRLGKITIRQDGHRYVEDYPLSWLIINAYYPKFIECIRLHKNKYVVHHKDGNPLNDSYGNFRVMRRSKHTSSHNAVNRAVAGAKVSKWFNDPKNKTAVEQRNKNISDWYQKPDNQEEISASNIQRSEGMILYRNDPNNQTIIDERTEKMTKTINDFWHNPNNKTASDDRRTRTSDSVIKWQQDPANKKVREDAAKKISDGARSKRAKWLPDFDHSFTARDYAEHYKIEFPTAQYRLKQLEKDGLVQTESTVIVGQRQNIYTTQEV